MTATTDVDQPARAPLERPRVLFVDDEPSVLAGLRRTLHALRGRLEAQFAGSGAEALQLMAATPADVIVSDMRMPGMDGAALLERVQAGWPGCVRIVLSGEADRASVLAAVGSAQQFLAKPCEADTLLAVVDRALAARAALADPRIRELIGGAVSLPALPEVYHRLVAAIDSPDLHLQQVTDILTDDVATSADVLRLVNSAFFGMPQEVSTVGTAVGLLGAENIRMLVLAGSVFTLDPTLDGVLDVGALRDRALRRATLGRRLATGQGWPDALVDQVGLACLLREAGLLVLAQGMPEATRELMRALTTNAPSTDGPDTSDTPDGSDPVTQARLEVEAFGCSVAHASAYLLGLWGFSPGVVAAVAAQPVPTADWAVAYGSAALGPEHLLDLAHRRSGAEQQSPA